MIDNNMLVGHKMPAKFDKACIFNVVKVLVKRSYATKEWPSYAEYTNVIHYLTISRNFILLDKFHGLASLLIISKSMIFIILNKSV